MSNSLQTPSQTARPLNVSYLVMGLVFLGIAGSWALRAGDVVDASQMQWLVPLVLVSAGVIGLVAFTTKGLRGRDAPAHDDPWPADTDHDGSFDPYPPYAPTERAADPDQTTRIEGEPR